MGNEPSPGTGAFSGVNASAVVYYYYGTTGWGTTYGVSPPLPTIMLGVQPQIGAANFWNGPGGDFFFFPIYGVSNQLVVIEASTNLVNWQPIQTNTLNGTIDYFFDDEWMNYRARFYRVR